MKSLKYSLFLSAASLCMFSSAFAATNAPLPTGPTSSLTSTAPSQAQANPLGITTQAPAMDQKLVDQKLAAVVSVSPAADKAAITQPDLLGGAANKVPLPTPLAQQLSSVTLPTQQPVDKVVATSPIPLPTQTGALTPIDASSHAQAVVGTQPGLGGAANTTTLTTTLQQPADKLVVPLPTPLTPQLSSVTLPTQQPVDKVVATNPIPLPPLPTQTVALTPIDASQAQAVVGTQTGLAGVTTATDASAHVSTAEAKNKAVIETAALNPDPKTKLEVQALVEHEMQNQPLAASTTPAVVLDQNLAANTQPVGLAGTTAPLAQTVVANPALGNPANLLNAQHAVASGLPLVAPNTLLVSPTQSVGLGGTTAPLTGQIQTQPVGLGTTLPGAALLDPNAQHAVASGLPLVAPNTLPTAQTVVANQALGTTGVIDANLLAAPTQPLGLGGITAPLTGQIQTQPLAASTTPAVVLDQNLAANTQPVGLAGTTTPLAQTVVANPALGNPANLLNAQHAVASGLPLVAPNTLPTAQTVVANQALGTTPDQVINFKLALSAGNTINVAETGRMNLPAQPAADSHGHAATKDTAAHPQPTADGSHDAAATHEENAANKPAADKEKDKTTADDDAAKKKAEAEEAAAAEKEKNKPVTPPADKEKDKPAAATKA